MRLKRGWTKKRIVEEFVKGESVFSLVWDAVEPDDNEDDERFGSGKGARLIDSILRAALREKAK